MTLVEAYPLLKPLHVTLVTASGILFAARGAAVLSGRRWPMRPVWRHASVAIDTLLLSAGVAMWVALSLHPLRNGWLGAKLGLLGVYIVLGSFALKRARSPRARALFYAAALAVFLWMVSIARAHDPLGALRVLLGG
ncbi:MAG: SirB2 family protein [Burkholderiaceae bacterium]|nr:SirB2 family protein [Burkholderiaceae bacterium]